MDFSQLVFLLTLALCAGPAGAEMKMIQLENTDGFTPSTVEGSSRELPSLRLVITKGMYGAAPAARLHSDEGDSYLIRLPVVKDAVSAEKACASREPAGWWRLPTKQEVGLAAWFGLSRGFRMGTSGLHTLSWAKVETREAAKKEPTVKVQAVSFDHKTAESFAFDLDATIADHEHALAHPSELEKALLSRAELKELRDQRADVLATLKRGVPVFCAHGPLSITWMGDLSKGSLFPDPPSFSWPQ